MPSQRDTRGDVPRVFLHPVVVTWKQLFIACMPDFPTEQTSVDELY